MRFRLRIQLECHRSDASFSRHSVRRYGMSISPVVVDFDEGGVCQVSLL